MPKTSSLDVIMQQLDALSLAELLEVKARVDALIQGKSSPFSQGLQHFVQKKYNYLTPTTYNVGSYRRMTFVSSETRDIDIEYQIAQFLESEATEDDSLEKVIELVDEWTADESGYDQETYPQIEAALNQNRLSV